MPALELMTSSGLGSLLGMRHALEPDHLAAVSTLVTGERSTWKAAFLGMCWGLGHTLTLLPGDSLRGRADALTMRGEAFWGLGRIDDAKAAWKGAAQRYGELDDTKAAKGIEDRLAGLDTGKATEPPAG